MVWNRPCRSSARCGGDVDFGRLREARLQDDGDGGLLLRKHGVGAGGGIRDGTGNAIEAAREQRDSPCRYRWPRRGACRHRSVRLATGCIRARAQIEEIHGAARRGGVGFRRNEILRGESAGGADELAQSLGEEENVGEEHGAGGKRGGAEIDLRRGRARAGSAAA